MDHLHLVNKVSRFFPSSFTSCSSRDVIESAIPIPRTTHQTSRLPPRPAPKPSSNSPRDPRTLFETDRKAWNYSKKSLPPSCSVSDGRKCSVSVKEKVKSNSSTNSGRWFSSSDDEFIQTGNFDAKSDAFFTLSSCSSESFIKNRSQSTSASWRKSDNKAFANDLGRCPSSLSADSVNQCDENFRGCELYYGSFRQGKQKRRQRTSKPRRKKVRPAVAAAVGDEGMSYAVEKASSDPYGDFRTSMVEMIIEKQIFGAKDLRKLLDCFLALNSSCYHKLIVEVFMEICDTLFAI